MNLDEFKNKLRGYGKEDFVFTDHAEIQALVRDINLKEVKDNIINPDKLVFAKKQKSKKMYEEKYDCYFAYSKNYAHRYILTLNRKIIIVTIIRINRDWQKVLERR